MPVKRFVKPCQAVSSGVKRGVKDCQASVKRVSSGVKRVSSGAETLVRSFDNPLDT